MKTKCKNSTSNNVEKICVHCGKKYYCSYKSRNTSKFCSDVCRVANHNDKEKNSTDDLIICPICNRKFKEINNAHILHKHNMSIDEWNEKYPNFDRLTKTTRLKKATLKNLTKEQSYNLKKGHTLEGYIEKYGESLGKIKYDEKIKNVTYVKSLEYYIQKHGEYGKEIYEKIQNKKSCTLDNCIRKYGEEMGEKKYKEWLENNKKSKTLLGYIEKYGEEEGYKRWFNKNKKMSLSSSHIDVNKIDEYKKYCISVDKETRLTLQLNKLENIELRSDEYHLDHMISKCYGFNNNIDPKIIASIYNLKIIPSEENLSKQKHCSQTIEDLLKKLNNKNEVC